MGDVRLTAGSSLSVLGDWLATVAGNLTGSQIYGYKGTRLSFGDTLVSQIRDGGPSGAAGGTNAIQVPSGSIAIGATTTDFRQGAIVQTGNDDHLAVSGTGWFAVADPAGTLTYTRNGEFHVDDGGNLVDAKGNFVLGLFDDSRGLVLDDGTSFVQAATPVQTGVTGNLGGVGVGDRNLAGIVPATATGVFGTPTTVGGIGTVLGTGAGGTSPNGTAIAASTTERPRGVTTDAQGNVYITEGNSPGRFVRMVPKQDGTYFGIPMVANKVYTIAGNGGTGWAGDGTLATATGLNGVQGVAINPAGDMLLASSDRIVFVPTRNGTYFGQAMLANRAYTLADSSTIPAGASFNAVSFDPAGHAFFTSSGPVLPVPIATNVGMIPASDGTYFGQAMMTGSSYVVAGTASNGYGPDGVLATTSNIRSPNGVAFDADGNLFFNDHWRVRMVPRQDGTYFGQAMQANNVYTIAGFSGGMPPADGVPATTGGIEVPSSLSVDPAGNVYFGVTDGGTVYMVPRTSGTYYGRAMQANYVYRIAGNETPGYGGDGGPGTSAQFNLVSRSGVHADGLGVWISDTFNNRIRYLAAGDSVPSSGGAGLVTFLDQPSSGDQDRAVATRFVAGGPIAVGLQRTGSNLPLMTLRSVDGTDTPITISLSDLNNRPSNTAYDNARLIADAINATSNVTGVAVSIVRDRKDPLGTVALVMGHVHRTLSEAFIDFTDPENPAADLTRTGAGILPTVTDSQGNLFHRINVMALCASAPGYDPQPGDHITFDATGQLINQSRGATADSAPPFATGIHVALVNPANVGGLQKSVGSSGFQYTDAAGRLQTGYAGQTKTSAINRFGIQAIGTSTIGAENTLLPQALEASNTSITDQLPELTIAQKVFTSTTKLVAVGNAIVDDLNGLIR